MKDHQTEQNPFNAEFIISIANKYKKHFAVIAVVSIVLSVIFSSEYFIKPKYKSTAVVYPSNFIPYSTESPTEQMLQLFESDEIRDGIIKDFDLFRHYEIDTTQKYPLTVLHGMMDENIQIDKTKFESVQIDVWDTDPKVASAIVDSIISKLHTKAKSLQRAKSKEVVIIFGNMLAKKKHEIDSMETALSELRMNYKILDFKEQVKAISKVYFEKVASGQAGGKDANSPIDRSVQGMLAKGAEFEGLKDNLKSERLVYNDIKKNYESVLKDLTKELTYSNIVTSPVPAEKKSYPVRSLIVFLFTSSMLFLSVIIAILYENKMRRELNREINA